MKLVRYIADKETGHIEKQYLTVVDGWADFRPTVDTAADIEPPVAALLSALFSDNKKLKVAAVFGVEE